MEFNPDEFIKNISAAPKVEDDGFNPDQAISAIKHEGELQEKYGEGIAPAQAALEGAARGLSFGVSDWLLRGAGVDKEALRERKERNPILSTTGNVVGTIAPLVLSGGTSALATGASKVGAGVLGVAKLGAATEASLLKALGSSASKEIAKNVLKTAASKAAGSAVEGAFYGAGQLVSETALGNKELNAEGILSTVGLSTLLNGTLGGTLGVISEAAPTVIEKARAASVKLKTFTKMNEETGKYLGLNEASRKLRQSATLSRGEHEKVMRDFEETLQNHYEQSNDISALLGATRNNLVEANLHTLDPVSTEAAKEAADTVMSSLSQSLKKMRSEPEIYSATGRIRQAEQAMDTLKQNLTDAKTSADIFRSIDNAKGVLWVASKRGKLVTESEEKTIQELFDMGKVAQKHLEDSTIYGGAAKAQAEANKTLNQYLTNKKILEKSLMEKHLLSNGSFEYRVSPTKIDTFLKNVKTIRNKGKNEALSEFLKSTDDLLSSVDSSFEPLKDLGYAQAAQKLRNIGAENKDLAQDLFSRLDIKSINTQTMKDLVARAQAGGLSPEDIQGIETIIGSKLDDLALSPDFVKKTIQEGRSQAFSETAANTKSSYDKTFDIANARGGLAQIRRDQSDTFVSPFDLASYATGYFLGGPVGLAAAAIIKLMNNPYQTVQGLAAIERAFMGVSKKIDRGVSGFVKVASEIPKPKIDIETRRLIAPASVVAMESASLDGKRKKFGDKGSAYNHRLNQLSEFVSDPISLSNKLIDTTTKMESFAPETASALRDKALRAVNYLYESAPKNPMAQGVLGPSDWKPSDSQLAGWERRLAAVHDPFVILRELESGLLTKETVDTVREVYPEIFNQIQVQLIDQISKKKSKMSYPYRAHIARMFGLQTEPSANPAYISSMQQNFNSPQGQRPAKSSGKSVSLPGSEMSGVERVTAR